MQSAYVGNPVTDLGVDVGPAQCSGSAIATYAYGAFNASDPSFAGNWTLLGLDIRFTGSGNGDGYALTGVATITPLPEPAALPLLLAGLGVLGLLARRRG